MGAEWTVISEIVQKVGFPVVVALWLLARTDRKLDRIADLMQKQLEIDAENRPKLELPKKE